MAKTSVADWSTTANSNTDLNSINIGEGWASADMNNAIREAMAQIATWYAARKGCSLTNSAAQTIPLTTNTALEFDTEAGGSGWDPLGFFDKAVSTTNIVVPAGVAYVRVTAKVQMAAPGGNGQHQLYVAVGGTSVCIASTYTVATLGTFLNVHTGPLAVSAGNVITVGVYQATDAGGLATVAGSARAWVEVL